MVAFLLCSLMWWSTNQHPEGIHSAAEDADTAGHKVLINGASGGVGTFATQIARALGAVVTGVCSTRNVEMVRFLGAAHVIDYTRTDFTKTGQRHDLIFDCVGTHSLSACRRVLNPGGRYVQVGGPSGRWMIGFLVRLVATLLLSRFMGEEDDFHRRETEPRGSGYHE